MLFVIALVLPCLVLVALGLRLLRQERELAEKRLVEEQHRRTSEVRQQLLAQMERVQLRVATVLAAQPEGVWPNRPGDPAVALVGWVHDSRLLLPWDTNPATKEFSKLLAEAPFSQKIREGEVAELSANRAAEAVDLYHQALALARHPAQRAQAQLSLARALEKAGRRAAATPQYRQMLATPAQIVDEHGVPLAFYAAGRLLDAPAERAAVLDFLRKELESRAWFSPTAAYMLRDLVDTLAHNAAAPERLADLRQAQRLAAQHVRRVEQALALQRDFPSTPLALAPTSQPSPREPVWIPYGQELWLVGHLATVRDSTPAIVVVHAQEVFSGLRAAASSPDDWRDSARFVAGAAQGEDLAPNFPGLKVVFAARAGAALTQQASLQRAFYLAALFVVLGVTLFGAYLLWRDVRRELGVAELRSQFVSSVSHELKTPLTAIRMFAETLRDGRSADSGMRDEYLETIVNESERLTRLLNNVLDFSKIEQGKKTYRPAPTALPEVLHAAVRALQYPLAQDGFDLRLQVDEDLPPIRADADALQQAILNLLINAMKYSGSNRAIDLSLRVQNGDAIIEVTDRGVGIPAEEQRHIFEKFYRVPTPENQRLPGTGLGLTLVEHIAHAHGGRVEVRSAAGQGSTFSIHLPIERST